MRRLARATRPLRIAHGQSWGARPAPTIAFFRSQCERAQAQASSSRRAVQLEMPLLLLFSGIVASSVSRAAAQRSPSEASGKELAEGELAGAHTLDDLYEVGDVLGHGHYAVVRRGKHRVSGKAVAIKVIPKTRTDISTIRREIEILKKVGSHQNIVNLLEVFETGSDWFLVMELVTGGELFERLVHHGPYSEKEASSLMRQVGAALVSVLPRSASLSRGSSCSTCPPHGAVAVLHTATDRRGDRMAPFSGRLPS